MSLSTFIKPELGRTSPHLVVDELIVRAVPAYAWPPELDGVSMDEGQFAEAGTAIRYEDRLQGRLVNKTKYKLSGVKYDLSYYDSSGRFLGLNKSRLFEEDELDVDDQLPIDMKVELPDGTSRCIFNVRAKKPGVLGRCFWG